MTACSFARSSLKPVIRLETTLSADCAQAAHSALLQSFLRAKTMHSAPATDSQLAELSTRRWGCESANRDAIVNQSLDAFHGRDINKVLQEIYACLFLRLTTSIFVARKTELAKDFLTQNYSCSSFKQVLRIVAEEIHAIVKKGIHAVERFITAIIARSCEKRKRRSRSATREVGYSRTKDFARKTAPRIT